MRRHRRARSRSTAICSGSTVADIARLEDDDPGTWLDGVPDTRIYFLRHNSDHHTFVLMPRPWVEHMESPPRGDITINQITWQVGSLREVVEARLWLQSTGHKIDRYGRDPGSNWHTYFPDPTGHTNELEYGIEQVGWDGLSKPEVMWPWLNEHPHVAVQAPESTELRAAAADGIDLTSGHRWIDELPKTLRRRRRPAGSAVQARPDRARQHLRRGRRRDGALLHPDARPGE